MTRIYLGETTAILFECILGDYLERKNPNYSVLVRQNAKERMQSCINSMYSTGLKSGLVREYESSGAITKGYIDSMIHFFHAKKDSMDRIKKDPEICSSRQYALAGFLVPTMIKEYRKDRIEGNKKIARYLECCINDDFEGALNVFGIDIGDTKILNTMIDNFKEYLDELDSVEIRRKSGEERE